MRKITNSRGQEEERRWKKVQSNWSLITRAQETDMVAHVLAWAPNINTGLILTPFQLLHIIYFFACLKSINCYLQPVSVISMPFDSGHQNTSQHEHCEIFTCASTCLAQKPFFSDPWTVR